MKLLLIQISDIHIKSKQGFAVSRLGEVSKAVKRLDDQITTAVVIFSGDVAHAGLAEEYTDSGNAIAALLHDLSDDLKTKHIHLLGVPGNHDCDFKNPLAQARIHVLENLVRSSAKLVDVGTLDICCSVNENFFSFLEKRQTLVPSYSVSHGYYEYLVPCGNDRILFRCFNTALSSTLPERAGQMFYPLSLVTYRDIVPPPIYTVAVFHHPYNWLAPVIKRAFAENVDSTCDLIFTGHEHETAYYKKEAFSGIVSEYIEGAVFQETDVDECGFNTVVVDLANSQERVYKFEWSSDHFGCKEITDGWRPYRRSRSGREFNLSEKVQDWMVDPGATFSHPAKPRLSLEDIFVPPNVQELTIKNNKEVVKTTIIGSKEVLNYISSKQRILIAGKERAGKTTLAKVLFRHYFSKGQVPIYINGSAIKSTEIEKFVSVVERNLRQDYDNPMLDRFNQLGDDQIVLILDDLDHAQLNARGRVKLLDAIDKRYRRIIVLGDDVLWLEEMATGTFGLKVLEEYAHIQIMEYGHVLRSAIIDKWYNVNREYVTNPDELEVKITRAEQYIDSFLRRSYLPSLPIFILTLLQGGDTISSVDNSAASYGYLYSVLITKQLAEGDKTLGLDKKVAYLVELAFKMFSSKQTELSEVEFEVFHRRHCSQYVFIDRAMILSELEESGILERFHDQWRFKYSYFYYHFVAEYLTRNIETPAAKSCIENICSNLQKDENANICLFLTHQSRSTFVLDTIVGCATKLFSEFASPQFDEDVAFLTRLYDKVPEMVYVNKTPEEMRQDRRRRLDEVARVAQTGRPEDEIQADELLKLVNDIKAAIQTLEVMGQIVKNYVGSMRNDPKILLVKECYELGLRIVGFIFDGWQKSGVEFVRSALDIILGREGSIETKQELERAIKQFIFYFCESASFSMIKRISHAVGTRDLLDVYGKVAGDTPTNAYRLIDLSVKLDSVGFPTGEIIGLHDRLKENVFCSRLLNHLVINHFYLFNTHEQTKQRICDRLNIKMQTLREADARGGSQKRLPDKIG